jgi:phospholipid transport system substrate-binding protein
LFAVRVVSSAVLAVSALLAAPVGAQTAPAQAAVTAQAPEAFIQSITNDVMATVKADKAIQSGDLRKITAVVDAKIMPNVNFVRMTAAAVGPAWRRATPDQRQRLQNEFKTLLVHTYAGAVSQVKDQVIEYLPSRARPADTDVVVRTVVKGKGDPIQLNYRLEKADSTWKVYDVNVLGAWLVQTHQSSFAQEINASGIDGLISKLAERNRQLVAKNAG